MVWRYINGSMPKKTLTLRKYMYILASGASELRKVLNFLILKLQFFQYFVGTSDTLSVQMTCLLAYMYRQIPNVPTKLRKSIIGGGGQLPPPPSGYASEEDYRKISLQRIGGNIFLCPHVCIFISALQPSSLILLHENIPNISGFIAVKAVTESPPHPPYRIRGLPMLVHHHLNPPVPPPPPGGGKDISPISGIGIYKFGFNQKTPLSWVFSGNLPETFAPKVPPPLPEKMRTLI